MGFELEKRVWWGYLDEGMQELLKTSVLLLEKVENWDQKFHDYAFVVFPAVKAYEGYLKKIFLDLGFIDGEDYSGKRFRVGRALNPSLDRDKYKNESVYDKIVEYCGGDELAKRMWDTWRESRNLLVHWFPEEKNAIDFLEARKRVEMVLDAMDAVWESCKRG